MGDKKRKNQTNTAALPSEATYERARWKTVMRIFGVVVILLLNISLLGSTMQSYTLHRTPPPEQEIMVWALVLFFDLTALLPSFLEAKLVKINKQAIEIQALFWGSTINWKDIVYFSHPATLMFAVLKTVDRVYLINKRDLKPFEELVQVIESKVTKGRR